MLAFLFSFSTFVLHVAAAQESGGCKKGLEPHNTHNVMTACALCYAFNTGESPSASFQRSLIKGSFKTCFYSELLLLYTVCVPPPTHTHTKKPVLAVGWWTLNNVSGRACGRKWISMGFRAISSFNKKWNSSKGVRREKACDLQSDGVGVTSDRWVFSLFLKLEMVMF